MTVLRDAVHDSCPKSLLHTQKVMNQPDTQPDVISEADSVKLRRPMMTWVGVTLILVSGVLWFSLFAIPFLPLTIGQKTALGAAVFVVVQIAWWTGAAIAGPGVVKTMTGWFRRA